VLLPLAAAGAVAVAARPAWRRSLGVPVLLVALLGVAAVPIATQTGEQLQAALPGVNPVIAEHARRGDLLLPFAVAFLVLLAAAVLVGRRADRGRAAATGGTTTATRTGTGTALAVLAAVAGIVVTGLVVWIGHAGATAVWQGVGQ
jgi:hypothetical protein